MSSNYRNISRSTSSTRTAPGSGTCPAPRHLTTPFLPGSPTGTRSPSRASAMQLPDLRHERGRHREAEPDPQRGERLPLWRPIPGRPTGGRSSSSATAMATAAATSIYVINADGSGVAVPGTRAWLPGLVTRRAEDLLHEQARKLGRALRHGRRRQRTAEADTQPGENGQRLACLVARAEAVTVPPHHARLVRAIPSTATRT